MRFGLHRRHISKHLPSHNSRWWVFRDRFSADLDPGSVDGTTAAPGLGLRSAVDLESKIFTSGGRLRGGGQDTPVWGESKVVWTRPDGTGWSRKAGRTLAALILFEDTIIDADVCFGWATAVDVADPRVDGHGLLQGTAGAIKVVLPGSTLALHGTNQRNLRPMQYLIGVTLNDIGALVWISTFGLQTGIQMTALDIPQFPMARLLWVEYSDQTATLFPSIAYYAKIDWPVGGYPNGNSVEDLRVVDPRAWADPDALAGFSDRFAREDSVVGLGNGWVAVNGVWGLTSGRAYLVSGRPPSGYYGAIHTTGLADGDGIYQWFVTMPDSATPFFGLLYRYQDPSNFYRIANKGLQNIYLQKFVGGVESQVSAYTNPWTPGQTYRISVIIEGGRHRLYVDNTLKFEASGHTELAEVAAMGFQIYDDGTAGRIGTAGHKFDQVAAFPGTFTLPAEIRRGKIPDILTGGEVVAQDSFTDDDAISLTAHAAESGGAWLTDTTDWTIQSNQASPELPLEGFTSCVQDLGTVDAECQVEITVPVGADDFFYGIVGRYEDADNWLSARLCMANYSPGAHEVELVYTLAGASNVRHKVNLGNYLAGGSTYTLKAQFKNDLVQVFLDGTPVLSYYTIDEDPCGTMFGLGTDYLGRTDPGGLFDNWIAREL